MADSYLTLFDPADHQFKKIKLIDLGGGLYSLKVDVDLTVADTVTIDTGAAITGESLEAGGSGLLGWLSSLRKKIADRLPAALAAGGGLKVEGVANGVAQPVTESGGAYTTPTHTAVTVGVATGEALAANVNRLYALLVNDSDTAIYIKLGAAAVLNAGIRINANGGSYEISKKLGNLYTGAINAIASAASKNLIVTEGV